LPADGSKIEYEVVLSSMGSQGEAGIFLHVESAYYEKKITAAAKPKEGLSTSTSYWHNTLK